MAKGDWKKDGVPFCKCGLQHYPDNCFKCHYVDKTGIEWRKATPFEDTMQLQNKVNSGRSAKYLTVTSKTTGLNYTLFVTDIIDIAVNFGIERGGVIYGVWDYVKRGQNYGIKLIGEL